MIKTKRVIIALDTIMSLKFTSSKIMAKNNQNNNNDIYHITERSVIDYYEYLTGAKNHVPYIIITFPFLNRNDLTLKELVVYSVIYSISMSKNISLRNNKNKAKDKNGKEVNTDELDSKFVSEKVSVTFEEIRQSLNINKPNLSKIIKDLENKKLIKTITYKRGCILYKKIKIIQDMTKYDEDFIKEAEAECRRLVMDGVTTLELGNKIVSMKDVCLKVCGESFDEIRGTKNSKADKVGKTNKVDKADKKVKSSKSKTGVVGITNEVQSVEDFEDGNEDAETGAVNMKAESKKVETKPKQEIYDDAYYEELFNSVEF